MKVFNPKDGAKIKVGDLELEVGATKDFKDSDAEYLLKTFGFLKLGVKEPKLGAKKKEAKKK